MANKMATWQYAANIAGGYIMGYTDNELITKKEAVNIGCDVSGSYSDNQCIPEVKLSKHDPYTYKTLTWVVTAYSGRPSESSMYLVQLYATGGEGGLGDTKSWCKVSCQTSYGILTFDSRDDRMPVYQYSDSYISVESLDVTVPKSYTDESTKTVYNFDYTYRSISHPL